MEGKTGTIEVLSPAGEARPAALPLARALPSLEGKIAGLLDNGKPSAREFLRFLAEDLLANHGVKDAVLVGKPRATFPVAAELLDRLERCDFVITAFGD